MKIISDPQKGPDKNELIFGKQLAQNFVKNLKENPETREMLSHWKSTVDRLTQHIKDVPDMEKEVKDRLAERVQDFSQAAIFALKLANPKIKDTEKAKILPRFQEKINGVMKADGQQNFLQDLNDLSDNPKHGKMDSREFDILRAMFHLGNRTDSLSNSREVVKGFAALETEGQQLNGDIEAFHLSMDVNINFMHATDPTMTLDNISDKANKIYDAEKDAREKWNEFNNREDVVKIHKQTESKEQEIKEKENRLVEMVQLHTNWREPGQAVANAAEYVKQEQRRKELFGDVDKKTAETQIRNLINELKDMNTEKNKIAQPIAAEQAKLKNNLETCTKASNNMKIIQNGVINNLQQYNSLCQRQKQFNQKALAAQNNQSFETLANNLRAIKNHLNGVSAQNKNHSNGPEYEAMDKQLTNAIKVLNDTGKSARDKNEELNKLNKATKQYLDAKNNQIFAFGSDLRKARLNDAKAITGLISNERIRYNNIFKQPLVRNIAKVANQTPLFKQKFRDIFSQKKQNAVRADQNNRRMLQGLKVPSKKNLSF